MSDGDYNICFMDSLSDNDLQRIFSYISVDDRYIYLETVCKRWKQTMLYHEWTKIDVSNLHRRFCRRGRLCEFERAKHFPSLYRLKLNCWMNKILISLIGRCSKFIRSLDISGLAVNEETVTLLRHFPKLDELNISDCFFTPEAANWLLEIPLKSLVLQGDEIDADIVLRLVDVSRLSIRKNFNFMHLENAHKLHSLSLSHSSITAASIKRIFETCVNLESLEIDGSCSVSGFDIESVNTPNFCRLKQLSVSLSSITFFDCIFRLRNLTELNLRISAKAIVVINLSSFLILEHLEKLSLQCKKLSENDLMRYVISANCLKSLDIIAKRICGVCIDTSLLKNCSTKLEILGLSLETVIVTTRIASNIVRISPNIQSIKLMDTKKKLCPICIDGSGYFEKDYNERILKLQFLQSITLPNVRIDSEFLILELLNDKPLHTLSIYMGRLKLKPSVAIAKFQIFATLVCLKLSPYVHCVGFDILITRLVNLQDLSFHLFNTTSTWNTFGAIGSHRELKNVDLRGCNEYFIKNVTVELAPLQTNRRVVKTEVNFVKFKPLFITGWTRLRYVSLPLSLEQSFDELLIRFEYCLSDD